MSVCVCVCVRVGTSAHMSVLLVCMFVFHFCIFVLINMITILSYRVTHRSSSRHWLRRSWMRYACLCVVVCTILAACSLICPLFSHTYRVIPWSTFHLPLRKKCVCVCMCVFVFEQISLCVRFCVFVLINVFTILSYRATLRSNSRHWFRRSWVWYVCFCVCHSCNVLINMYTISSYMQGNIMDHSSSAVEERVSVCVCVCVCVYSVCV